MTRREVLAKAGTVVGAMTLGATALPINQETKIVFHSRFALLEYWHESWFTHPKTLQTCITCTDGNDCPLRLGKCSLMVHLKSGEVLQEEAIINTIALHPIQEGRLFIKFTCSTLKNKHKKLSTYEQEECTYVKIEQEVFL